MSTKEAAHRRLAEPEKPYELGAEAVEHAVGSVQLPGDILGMVTDRPVGAPERHVRRVRAQHTRLEERFDPVPDLLAVTVEVERVRHQVEAVIARARILPVDDPGERAVIEGEHVVGVQVEVDEPARREPAGVRVGADRLDEVDDATGAIGLRSERVAED